MERVLLVEDSKFIGRVLKNKIQKELNLNVTWYENFHQAVEGLSNQSMDYFVALLDLNLPDALDGEIVDYVMAFNIPVIVFTGDYSDDLRDEIWSKQVIDYVLKEGHHNFDYIVRLINRIRHNRNVKVLIVDDSKFFRNQLAKILKVHQFQLFEAASGVAAVELLEAHPDIRLAIVDFNMPDMNGAELTKEIRKSYSIHELAVIGLSAHGDSMLSAQFIKSGANDFIHKPFINEEFYCRISQNLDLLDYVEKIQESAHTDHLTGLFNRRYFLDTAKKIFSGIQREGKNCVIAMVDIDHFKKVNDSYGHDTGDEVLKHVSNMLKRRFRESDIVSRFGGEEFCIIASGMRPDSAKAIFELLRHEIEFTPTKVDGQEIFVTVSIGACAHTGNSLDEMIKKADHLLYQAKTAGRNKVEISSSMIDASDSANQKT